MFSFLNRLTFFHPRALELLVMAIIGILGSCNEKAADPDKERTIKKVFREIASSTSDITFTNTLTETDSLNYFTYGYLYMGGGIAAGDINNDGLIDLYFTGNMVPNALYLNKGDLQFENISVSAGVAGDDRWYTGVTMADVNNDGFLDIYCSVGGRSGIKTNQLFLNNGDETFSERAEQFGLAEDGNSVQTTFFDYDKDGDLDAYVANYPPTPFDAPNQYYSYKMQSPKTIETDKLFRNDNGQFTDATEASGVTSFGLSLSATVGDMNNDGWPDIYVSNDFSTPDLFYINNKNGTFSEVVKEVTKQTSFFGMGTDIADVNNDGWLDIFQVDMTAKDNRRSKSNMASMNPKLFWNTVGSGFHYQYMQNSFQLNNGILNDTLPDFSNIARLTGTSSTDWSWAPLFGDFDNDGHKDLFITNGIRREINNRDYFIGYKKAGKPKDSLLERSLAIPSEKIDNFMFRNTGNLDFEEVNDAWGISHKGFSNGSVYADLDNDGDLEIVTNNIDEPAKLYENLNPNANNFLSLDFKGSVNDVFGSSVKVYLYLEDGHFQFQEMTFTRGFQSSVAPRLHFGVGKIAQIDSVAIQWPNGDTEIKTAVKTNQLLTVSQEDAKRQNLVQNSPSPLLSKPIFKTESDTAFLKPYRHLENYYNDFNKEILLPYQTSMLGPLTSVADLNGDGLDDFVVGGSHNNPMGIFLQTATGFERTQIASLEKERAYEDMDIVIFDMEGDGDNDLYVVSGGNEFAPESEQLQDRIYVNDGNGHFHKAEGSLPEITASGLVAKPHDFDKDGDLDLFVGGRLVPGGYPEPTNSYIMENRSTPEKIIFKDVTATVAPELQRIGMVSDALWSDYDADGWDDLILVGEWMPITVFKNTTGRFKNTSENLGIADTHGWWYHINSADFDGDGDMDYIVGNLGLNYKYQATEAETFDVYYRDFDDNSSKDIVLSYFNEGKQYPLRGRECSSQQMPGIKKKFESYQSFSEATLEEVYTEDYLNKSLNYKIKSFASVYLENDNGTFRLSPLPRAAQISNINSSIIQDFNGDGKLDVMIAGNLHTAEVETPRNDAGNGLLLLQDENGSFLPISGRDSGLFATGDVRDVAKITFQEKEYLIVAKNNDYLQLVSIRH